MEVLYHIGHMELFSLPLTWFKLLNTRVCFGQTVSLVGVSLSADISSLQTL